MFYALFSGAAPGSDPHEGPSLTTTPITRGVALRAVVPVKREVIECRNGVVRGVI